MLTTAFGMPVFATESSANATDELWVTPLLYMDELFLNPKEIRVLNHCNF